MRSRNWGSQSVGPVQLWDRAVGYSVVSGCAGMTKKHSLRIS